MLGAIWRPGLMHTYLSLSPTSIIRGENIINGMIVCCFIVYLIMKLASEASNRSMKDPHGMIITT